MTLCYKPQQQSLANRALHIYFVPVVDHDASVMVYGAPEIGVADEKSCACGITCFVCDVDDHDRAAQAFPVVFRNSTLIGYRIVAVGIAYVAFVSPADRD